MAPPPSLCSVTPSPPPTPPTLHPPPKWMAFCMWDNLLLYPCFEWLCFLSRVFIRWQGGAGGRGLICLCPSPRSRSGEEGARGSIVNYHNWSIPRVSSSREWTGQGLSSSKQEHFFAPKSSSKRSFFFFFFFKVLRTDDIGAPEDAFFFLYCLTLLF